jgi:tetratricopeptide (TPR) repeat protein
VGGDFLVDLLLCMVQNGIITNKEERALRDGAKIYVDNKIMNLSLSSKYFYTDESLEEQHKKSKQYEDIIESIFEKLQEYNVNWGDIGTIYLQYAALYMVYEGDLYCIKNKQPLLYTGESIVEVCNILLENKSVEVVYGSSIYMLLAQIQEDLLEDVNNAYSNYLPACKNYNAYVFYRKALYWYKQRDYKKATDYLAKSVLIYPWYYRAWHMLGICYSEQEDWIEALRMFEYVEIILMPRLTKKRIRPMEIEYLFKAENQCGYIWNKRGNNIQKSIVANLLAEKVWKAIDDSEFIPIICDNNKSEIKRMQERLKRELGIKKIYEELAKLYERIGEKEKAVDFFIKSL